MVSILIILLITGIICLGMWIYESVKFNVNSWSTNPSEGTRIKIKSKQCNTCGRELNGWYYYGELGKHYETCGYCQNVSYQKQEGDRLSHLHCPNCKISTSSDYCPNCGEKALRPNWCYKCQINTHTQFCTKCGGKTFIL